MLIQTWSKLCLIIFFCILLILWRPFFMVIKASWMGETFGNFRFQFFWKITPLLQLLLLRGENPIEKLAASSSNIVISQTALFITFQVCNFRGSREMIKFLFIQVQDIICKAIHMCDEKLVKVICDAKSYFSLPFVPKTSQENCPDITISNSWFNA